jgi:hypothetical protein
MKAERQKLLRLQRLERVRAIAKQAAAVEAARAEGTLSQLLTLAQRTRGLAADYAVHDSIEDGASLRQMMEFAGGLQNIAARTSGDADAARTVADDMMADLATAERRRAAVEERAERQARRIAKADETPALGARKRIGTGLDR